MKASALEVLIWVLIYGGLLALGLGLAVQSEARHLGLVISVVGAGVAALGLVLIGVRSLMKP